MDDTVSERISRIEKRLDALEKMVKIIGTPLTKASVTSIKLDDLLSLSGSLQKTMLAIQELEEATAAQVSVKTRRARSVETIYLNQLTRLGYLTKDRKGRKVYFKTIQYY